MAQNLSQLPENKKRLLRTVLTFMGILLTAAGITSLLVPNVLGGLLGDDSGELGMVLGAALTLVGISDIAIAQILLKGSNTHD